MIKSKAKVYMIPCFLDEHAVHVIPAYILDALKECDVFFTENERSARRYVKSLWKDIVIDSYEWFAIHKAEESAGGEFQKKLKEGKTIGIISEAGCPGIADPGQFLVSLAQESGVLVSPLVGPSSIILALMASGMNGQRFQFAGYLPIEKGERMKMIRELENESQKKDCTQIFIETPYRNNQLLDILLKSCRPATSLCIAANITSTSESIKTQTMESWKKNIPDLHKQPVIFLLYAR
jgi:16S rRNA (cytidine1402-2'-O)-methyltransferase